MSVHPSILLEHLGLDTAAVAVQRWLDRAAQEELSYADFLEGLLEEEVVARKTAATERRLREAGFPYAASIEQFDFRFRPELKRQLVLRYFDASFVTQALNLTLVGPPAWATPYQQTTPIDVMVAPTATVEIVDPTHPLAGLTLPLLGITVTPHRGRVCVVQLHPGVQRLVPVTATNLAGLTPSPSPCRLSVAAVQAFLAVVASQAVVSQEDADATASACCPTDPSHPPTAAPTGRATRSGTAAAARGRPPPAAPDLGHPAPGRPGAGPAGSAVHPTGGPH